MVKVCGFEKVCQDIQDYFSSDEFIETYHLKKMDEYGEESSNHSEFLEKYGLESIREVARGDRYLTCGSSCFCINPDTPDLRPIRAEVERINQASGGEVVLAEHRIEGDHLCRFYNPTIPRSVWATTQVRLSRVSYGVGGKYHHDALAGVPVYNKCCEKIINLEAGDFRTRHGIALHYPVPDELVDESNEYLSAKRLNELVREGKYDQLIREEIAYRLKVGEPKVPP